MVLIGDYMWLIGQYWTILNILDYWTLQDYNKLYRTIPDHIGLYWTRLYMTLHDYTRLYWNILVYSSKEFKGFKKSVTLRHSDRQTQWLTGPDLERHAPLKIGWKRQYIRVKRKNVPMGQISSLCGNRVTLCVEIG